MSAHATMLTAGAGRNLGSGNLRPRYSDGGQETIGVEISNERDGGALIVQAAGRVDGSNSQEFQDGLEAIINDDERAVVLDLQELSYISSSGLRVMLLIARKLQRQQAKFALCSLTDSIREVFEISGFDRIIPVHASRSEAVAAVAG